jgi:hypothetical protein
VLVAESAPINFFGGCRLHVKFHTTELVNQANQVVDQSFAMLLLNSGSGNYLVNKVRHIYFACKDSELSDNLARAKLSSR